MKQMAEVCATVAKGCMKDRGHHRARCPSPKSGGIRKMDLDGRQVTWRTSRGLIARTSLFLVIAMHVPNVRANDLSTRPRTPLAKRETCSLAALPKCHQRPRLLAAVPDEGGGQAIERRRAVQATVLSFLAPVAFALGVVMPFRGKKDTLDFITGFLSNADQYGLKHMQC